jgi:nucleotide-binding universal stress UspA family protein
VAGILVGVDGSEHSRRALVWAMHEAAQHHVPLTVMTVHQVAPRPVTEVYWNIPILEEDRHDVDVVRATVQEFVDKVAHETGEKVPEVTVTVVTGDVAEELVKASRDHDILVVGRRGRGEFAKLLLGSVSSKVTHHAACPTVVIPDAR